MLKYKMVNKGVYQWIGSRAGLLLNVFIFYLKEEEIKCLTLQVS